MKSERYAHGDGGKVQCESKHINVPDKRGAHTSESRTPPTFCTFTRVQLNHLLEHSIYIAIID